jgi:hypothetical protein
MMRRLLRYALPGKLHSYLVSRYYQHKIETFFKERTRLSKRLIAKYGNRVLHGPFKNMTIIKEFDGGVSTSQVLGSYELELHPYIFALSKRMYSTIVDLGCANGYYSVGLALVFPEAEVWGFDIKPECVRISLLRAQMNNVDQRSYFGGCCSHTRLNQLCSQRTLVFSDIEGGEKQLLDPVLVPNLSNADLVVELHDSIDPTITHTLIQRFTPTHACQLVEMQPRNASDFPEIKSFTPQEIEMAFSEQKLKTTWGVWTSIKYSDQVPRSG